ncbi:MAG: SDR family oxidoreductase [Rhodospirillales bacterium]|nr:SDR family oxidoreductase [Rhodospirillales bacterium]
MPIPRRASPAKHGGGCPGAKRSPASRGRRRSVTAHPIRRWQARTRRRLAADHAQHPAGHVGRPGDIAEAVLYLLSPHAGFVTGANLVIDDGMTRKMIYV